MLKFAIILVLGFLSASATYAQTPQETSASSNLNEPARGGKIGGVGLRYGQLVGAIGGGGIEAVYFLRPDVQLGVMYASGEHDLKAQLEDANDSVDTEEALLSTKLIHAFVRSYFGASFNVSAGITHRTIDFDYHLKSLSTGSALQGNVSGTALCATFTIGNQWAWDNGFNIGADWIGYSIPLDSTSSADTSTSGPASASIDEVHKDAEDLGKFMAKASTFMALVLNVGYNF